MKHQTWYNKSLSAVLLFPTELQKLERYLCPLAELPARRGLFQMLMESLRDRDALALLENTVRWPAVAVVTLQLFRRGLRNRPIGNRRPRLHRNICDQYKSFLWCTDSPEENLNNVNNVNNGDKAVSSFAINACCVRIGLCGLEKPNRHTSTKCLITKTKKNILLLFTLTAGTVT